MDLNEIQHGELFPHRRTFFSFGRNKFPNSQKEISVVNSDFFPAKQKNCPTVGEKLAMLDFIQVHQKSSNIGSEKKLLKLGAPIEIST